MRNKQRPTAAEQQARDEAARQAYEVFTAYRELRNRVRTYLLAVIAGYTESGNHEAAASIQQLADNQRNVLNALMPKIIDKMYQVGELSANEAAQCQQLIKKYESLDMLSLV